MKGVQDKLEEFSVLGVKPGFMNHEEEGKGSAFEDINQNSFEGNAYPSDAFLYYRLDAHVAVYSCLYYLFS